MMLINKQREFALIDIPNILYSDFQREIELVLIVAHLFSLYFRRGRTWKVVYLIFGKNHIKMFGPK